MHARSITGARACLLVALAAFWAGLALAARRFPGEFDWRYMTVSNLFSAGHNPGGYLLGALGVACCAVAGLASLARAQRRVAGPHSFRVAPRSGLLAIGFSCMLLAAISPARWLFAKGHDWLAVIAFLTLGAGLIYGAVSTFLQRYPPPLSARRLCASAYTIVAVWPVIGAGVTQAYLAMFRPDLPWVTLAWRSQGFPLILSFALWEWLTCVSLSLCMAIVALGLADSDASHPAAGPTRT